MTESEYKEKLIECLNYKRWQVVADAVTVLNNLAYNYEAVIREVQVEHQAIIKMLNSNVSNKQKLDFVKSFAEDWQERGYKNGIRRCNEQTR